MEANSPELRTLDLNIIPVPKGLLQSMPANERVFLIQGLHVANELNVLIKMLTWVNVQSEDTPVTRVEGCQAMILGRVLTGKIAEGWKLIWKSYVKGGLEKSHGSQLNPSGQQAFTQLSAYFENRSNIINKVRDGFAAHYDASRITKHIDGVPDDQNWEIVVGHSPFNTMFSFAENVINRSMLQEIILDGNPMLAMQKLVIEVTNASVLIHNFMAAFLALSVEQHFGGKKRFLEHSERIQLTDIQDFSEIQIPFFTTLMENS